MKFGGFYQDEFGTNCAVDKYIKILLKISVEVNISADNLDRYIYQSVSRMNVKTPKFNLTLFIKILPMLLFEI